MFDGGGGSVFGVGVSAVVDCLRPIGAPLTLILTPLLPFPLVALLDVDDDLMFCSASRPALSPRHEAPLNSLVSFRLVHRLLSAGCVANQRAGPENARAHTHMYYWTHHSTQRATSFEGAEFDSANKNSTRQ